jgi:hypothetical protein
MIPRKVGEFALIKTGNKSRDYRCNDEKKKKKNYPAWIVNPQPKFSGFACFW